jgi:glycosyltransferase involved in cell wall biosynthesis
MPLISVITPASRDVRTLSYLLNDFKNQTLPKNMFEHIIVYDGKPPDDVVNLMKTAGPWTKFSNIEKDTGNMKIAPGTRPRNHGVNLATGDWVVFADDDDRYNDRFLETFAAGLSSNIVTIIQMSCQESKIYKNGNPNRIILIPEIGLHEFPIICHVGTPCFIVKREWALECPWQNEPEHDFRFIKRIIDKYKPMVQINGGMLVDVDGLVLRGARDWVSYPPFFRG